MRLYEFEGKHLLQQANFQVPELWQLGQVHELYWQGPCVLKTQVLFGNRAKHGLIHVCTNQAEWDKAHQTLSENLAQLNLSPTTAFLMEPLISFTHEILIGIRYDTRYRQPVLYLNTKGGSGIEERNQSKTWQLPLNQLPPQIQANDLPLELMKTLPFEPETFIHWVQELTAFFWQHDLTLLEINPLVFSDGQPIVLDTKIELDDQARFRHPRWQQYPPRSLFNREPTSRELQAQQVNASDHRGVAGASYFDLDGDVGILAAGGGASILAMDTLLGLNLQPANYTEYSGNPTREKVAALTKVVLQKPNLQALWVVGGHANFTDQYETLMGVMDGLEQSHLPVGFPVIIRRSGPRIEEAYQELQKRNQALQLNLHLFTSDVTIPESAETLQQGIAQTTPT